MSQYQFKCPKPTHQFSEVLFICLDNKCKNKRKCCLICVDQEHRMHEIVSIQKFIKEINQNLQRYNQHPDKIQINKFLNTIRKDFNQSFNDLKTTINQGIQKIQSKVHEFLKTVQQIMSTNSEQKINNHILETFHSTDSIIEEYLNFSKKAENIELGSFKEVKRKIYDYFYSFEEVSDIFRSDLQKSFQRLQKNCTVNCLAPKKNNQNFMLSQTNKALCIQLEDSKTTLENIIAPYNYTVCCLDRPLDCANKSFCVKINKNPSKKIWFGVCILNIVKKNNFIGCYGTGKGTYALDQSGGPTSSLENFAAVSSHHQLKSHIPGAQPYLPKWNFKEGDIVYVKAEILGSYLSFYVLNQNYDPQGSYPLNKVYSQYYSMEIKVPQGDIYPFIGFSGMGGDQVTILSKSEIDKVVAPYGNKWLSFIEENPSQDQEDLSW